MTFSGYLGRWTTTKAALAVAGALVIGGAFDGALAFTPTAPAPIRVLGIAEFLYETVASSVTRVLVVPAGRNFLLTDLVVTNRAGDTALVSVYTGVGGVCSGALRPHFKDLAIRDEDNLILALQTGIPFGSGQVVCVGSSNPDVTFNGCGFYYTGS